MSGHDLVITGGTVAVTGLGIVECDVAVSGGRIVGLGNELARVRSADEIIDARGKLVLPGAIDAHFHLGVYRDLGPDTLSETGSAVVGGVTSVISYFRTGGHYLKAGGRYPDVLPSVFNTVGRNAYTDFGFHVAPMSSEHLGEIPWLIEEAGVASLKFYFHYLGGELAKRTNGAATDLLDDGYDLGHLYSVMEAVAEANQSSPTGARISLSLHCENADLVRHFTGRFAESSLPPLEKYGRSRPPLSERLAIHEAIVLADATGAPINLVHLSSGDAVAAARALRKLYPSLDVGLETTTHHLCLAAEELEFLGAAGKVNPPLRSARDRDALWAAIADGTLDWVASDHACCLEFMKPDIDQAVPGFSGSAAMYPALLTEGHLKRGLPVERIVQVLAENPARAFACYPRKGAIAIGSDADIVIADLDKEQMVTPELLQSAQDFTPYAGMRLRGWPKTTILRGNIVMSDGRIVGPPTGRYLARPLALVADARAR